MQADCFSVVSDAIFKDFVWNGDDTCAEELIFQLADFHVSGGDKAPSLVTVLENSTVIQLEGVLKSPVDDRKRLPYKVNVENIYFDRGYSEDADETRGFWACSTKNDARFKLLPYSPMTYNEGTCRLLDQLSSSGGLGRYTTSRLDGKRCLRMENFSLTDALGSAQTLILPPGNSKRYCLRGTLLLPDSSSRTDPPLPRRLQFRTYVNTRYVVDLGDDPFAVHPEFCVEDCHGTWIVLSGPGHPDYAADHAATVKRTIGNLSSYDWPCPDGEAAGEESSGPSRHVTNYCLIADSGEAHHLEVGDLSQGASFALWAELTPPPGSPSPPLNIRLRVCQHSIDVGRSLYDASKGVWLQDLRGDWYRLGDPAPEYASIAQPLLRKAGQLLRLTDALLFQDRSDALSTYLPERCKYQCLWSVRAVQKQAHPKFCLHFVMSNKRFVEEHLSGIFDENASEMLFSSIRHLQGVPAPPPEPVLPESGAASKLPAGKRPRSSHDEPRTPTLPNTERTGYPPVLPAGSLKPAVLPTAPPRPIAKRTGPTTEDLRFQHNGSGSAGVTDPHPPQPRPVGAQVGATDRPPSQLPPPWLPHQQEPQRYPQYRESPFDSEYQHNFSHKPYQQEQHQQQDLQQPAYHQLQHQQPSAPWSWSPVPSTGWPTAPSDWSRPSCPPAAAARVSQSSRGPEPGPGIGVGQQSQWQPASVASHAAPPHQPPAPAAGYGHKGVRREEEFFVRNSAASVGNGRNTAGAEYNVIDTRQTINGRGAGPRPPLPPLPSPPPPQAQAHQQAPQVRRSSRFDDAADPITPRPPSAGVQLQDGTAGPATAPSATRAPPQTEVPRTTPSLPPPPPPPQRQRRSRFNDASEAGATPVPALRDPPRPSPPPGVGPGPEPAPAPAPPSPPAAASTWYKERDPRRPPLVDLTGGPAAGRGREATLPAWMTAGQLVTTQASAAAAPKPQVPAARLIHEHNPHAPADALKQPLRSDPPLPRADTRQPEEALKPSAAAEREPERREEREPCKICKGRMKKSSCTNDRHKHGCLVRPSAQAPPAPLPDRALGIDSARANEQAAADLLRAMGCVGGVHCGEEEEENGNGRYGPALTDSGLSASVVLPAPTSAASCPFPAVGSTGDQAVPQDPAAASTDNRKVSDDIAVEHRRYASKHSGDPATSSSSTGAVIYSRTGVWGRINASAVSQQGQGLVQGPGPGLGQGGKLELVRLGEREDDPRRRLEQTRRSSLGAFAQSAALEAAKLRHSPPSASMRPTKSVLKVHNGNGNGTAGYMDSAGTAHRPVQWSDMLGRELYIRHRYEGGDYESPNEATRTAF